MAYIKRAMDVNNTILFQNNVDARNKAAQNREAVQVSEVAKKPVLDAKSIQKPTDETKIPTSLELTQKSIQAEEFANEGKLLDRGSLVNFLV